MRCLLAIESSCDETSAAVLRGYDVLSNLIATQKIHEQYGGVVPELASRAHQANIVPVVEQAMDHAGIAWDDLQGIAVTQGPGLMGALHVGFSFAKSLAMALNIPLAGVNHMEAHVLAHFAADCAPVPRFPFLCLTVSGGHTQTVWVKSPLQMEVIGTTIDDAAGEAFDKAAKVMGLPYPGGPIVDAKANEGNPLAFKFTKPVVSGLDYSFSGLKTNLLYFLKSEEKKQPGFTQARMNDICASYQKHIVDYLLDKFRQAIHVTGVSDIALAGGVSANSALRAGFVELAAQTNTVAHIPPFAYCTDNAAMVGIAGQFLLDAGRSIGPDALPRARFEDMRSLSVLST
jgi:N6-L-threonylcarbamoyladenine synthase